MERPPEPRIRTFRGGGSPEPGMRSPGGQRRWANRSLTVEANESHGMSEPSAPPEAVSSGPLTSAARGRKGNPGPLTPGFPWTEHKPLLPPRQLFEQVLVLEPVLFLSLHPGSTGAYLSGPRGSQLQPLSRFPEIYRRAVPYPKGQRGALGGTGRCRKRLNDKTH